MKTLRLDPNKDENAVLKAADIIKRGGLVAMPTETVYGLAANAFDTAAVKKIFEAKGRPQDNPLIVHIADISMLDELCKDISDTARKIASAFWPGPLTVILKKRAVIPDIVTCGLDSVGVRFPSHKTAQALIRATGLPLAAPSANTSGRPSPTAASHVLMDMDGRIDAVLDGGECEIGVESTVLDLTGSVPVILRPGGVTLEMIRTVSPDAKAGDFNRVPSADERVLSPGMKYRHYAPKAPVTLITGSADDVFRYIEAHTENKTLGIMCFEEYEPLFRALTPFIHTYGRRGDMLSQSSHIFAALRAFDAEPARKIFVYADADTSGLGMAINNRLSKAAGFDIVTL
ncbi:MAG: threonylcarbamoyl-AMP synthase [Clostridia bacterium]|nr:threonylcarbamoyl-AMP synthase [Clostridia bacterium]